MKHRYLVLLLLLSFITTAQTINFPDPDFKARLLSMAPGIVGAYNSVGNQIAIDTNGDGEIQVSEAHIVYKLVLNYFPAEGHVPLHNLSGIENFINLRELHCSMNQIANADLTALSNLEVLYFQENNCNSLFIHGLSNLEKAYCGMNNLIEFNLTGLSSLQTLQCHSNNLTAIDLTGLTSLTHLDLYDNHISTLDASGSTELINLGCSQNNLTSLNVSGLTNLTVLYCGINQLSELDLTGLQSLNDLECYDNQLTSLNINGLNNLLTLLCFNNPITSIDFSQTNPIGRLWCGSSTLASLNVSGCFQLYDLGCNNSQLTSLDVSGNPNLNSLNVFDNPLHHLNLKNGPGVIDFISLGESPTLQYICADESEITQITQLTEDLGYMCIVSSECTFELAGSNIVTGTIRYDANDNGCDNNDNAMLFNSFNLTTEESSISFTSNSSGSFNLPLNEGTYTITPILSDPGYFTVTPSSATVVVSDDIPQIIENFCVSPIAEIDDLEVTIIPTTPARPGFDATYRLILKNKGTTALSGSLIFTYQDNLMDFVEASLAPDISAVNMLTWNYSNIAPFEEITIDVAMNINSPVETPAVNIDDQLEFTIAASIEGDMTPEDNLFGIKQVVVGSFDPNDKTCVEGNTIVPEMVGEYVHYVIRFENTGTFYAENIIVHDLIDEEKFDVESIVPLQSSHNYFMRVANGNSVEFVFQNIMLPGIPSEDRHGFVAFKIKTKETLQLDDTFSNKASIYFDFNAPVITNDAVTTVALPLNRPSFKVGEIVTLYPNPVSNVLNISFKDQSPVKSVAVYNIMGQLISAPQFENTIDVSGLASGTYIVKVSTTQGIFSSRFVKN